MILATLGCLALTVSVIGIIKKNVAVMVTGQCLGVVILVLTLSSLLSS